MSSRSPCCARIRHRFIFITARCCPAIRLIKMDESGIYDLWKISRSNGRRRGVGAKNWKAIDSVRRHVARLVLLSSTISRKDVSLENGARNHRSIFAKPHESLQVWIYIYIYILDVCMKHIKEIGNFREDRWPTFCREGKGKLGKLLNYGVVLVFRMCF